MSPYVMSRKPIHLAVTLICQLFLVAIPAFSQQKEATTAGPVTSKAAYDLALASATKWQEDARLFDFSNLASAPVDSEGRSAEWTLKFFSKKAGKVYMVSVANGHLRIFEFANPGGRIIEITAKTNLDSKQLMAKADAAGGSPYRKAGVMVSIGLVQNRLPGVGPLWHVSYAEKGPGGMPGKELFLT